MELNGFEAVVVHKIGELTYFMTCGRHLVDDFGEICEYGIGISLSQGTNRCTLSLVPHISSDKNFISKIISLLAEEQALPISLEDIIEDLIG